MLNASLERRMTLGDDGATFSISEDNSQQIVATPTFSYTDAQGNTVNVESVAVPVVGLPTTDTPSVLTSAQQMDAADQAQTPAVGQITSPAAAADSNLLTNAAKGIGAGLATVLVRATGGQVQYNAAGQPIGFTTAGGAVSPFTSLLTGSTGSILLYGLIGLVAYRMLSSRD